MGQKLIHQSLLLILLGTFTLCAHSKTSDLAKEWVELSRGDVISLLQYTELLEDQTGKLTWQQVIKQDGWASVESNDLNLGIKNSVFWFRVHIKYTEPHTRVFQIHYPLLDFLSFYLIEEAEVLKHVATGDALPFDSRSIKDKDFVLTHFHTDQNILTLLIKVKTQGTMVLPLTTTDIENYSHNESVENIAYGIYFGITIAMFLYNLMLFVYLKEKTYLYYCVFVFVIFISAISYTGHGFYWLWPNASYLNTFMAPLSASLGFLAATIFMSSFLQIRRRGVWGKRVFNVSIALSCFVITSVLMLDYSTNIKVISFFQIILTIIFLGYSGYLWHKGIKEAKYFTIAWLSFIAGNVVSALRVVGFFPSNDFTIYANLYGNVIEMLMLSMGLAYRFETMREVQVGLSRELRSAQQESIKNLEKFRDLFQRSPVGLFRFERKKNTFFINTKLNHLIGDVDDMSVFFKKHFNFSDYKLLLRKQRVKDKIIKLTEDKYFSLTLFTVKDERGRLTEIEGSIIDISEQQRAEALMVAGEKEKLNTLTQLVVGISHQFNTPLGVLVSTEGLVKENLSRLLQDTKQGKLKKDELLATLDLVLEAVNLSSENTKIMSSILKDLRNSINTRSQLNLSIIDSEAFFLDLLGYFKSQIKEDGLICNLEMKLSVCENDKFSSDYDVLSEVFIKLFSNTYFHGFPDKEEHGVITINMTEDDQRFYIEYRDSGRGLDEFERENIFVPFFTGKNRKKANSGLGMYILHNQVVKVLLGSVELLAPDSGFGIKIQLPKKY